MTARLKQEKKKERGDNDLGMHPSRQRNDDYEFLFKVVITGDTGSGKSKIIERFAHDTFNAPSKATIGVEFVSKILEINEGESRVRLQLWDTAGQVQFASLTASFFRNAHAVLLAYDVHDKADRCRV